MQLNNIEVRFDDTPLNITTPYSDRLLEKSITDLRTTISFEQIKIWKGIRKTNRSAELLSNVSSMSTYRLFEVASDSHHRVVAEAMNGFEEYILHMGIFIADGHCEYIREHCLDLRKESWVEKQRIDQEVEIRDVCISEALTRPYCELYQAANLDLPSSKGKEPLILAAILNAHSRACTEANATILHVSLRDYATTDPDIESIGLTLEEKRVVIQKLKADPDIITRMDRGEAP